VGHNQIFLSETGGDAPYWSFIKIRTKVLQRRIMKQKKEIKKIIQITHKPLAIEQSKGDNSLLLKQ